jgi:hypothetical protein
MPAKEIPLPEQDLSLCPDTGALNRTYTLNGVECPKVVLDDKLAKQQSGYTLIDADLEDVESWLTQAYNLFGPQEVIPDKRGKPVIQYTLASEETSLSLVKALWFSAIVVYAKCFTQTEGRGVKLERSNLPDYMKDCHDKIMTYRNTIVAHAGETTLETAPLEIILSPKSMGIGFLLRNNCKRVEFADDRNETVTFTDLVDTVHKSVKAKRHKLTSSILDRTKKTASKDLYKMARKG